MHHHRHGWGRGPRMFFRGPFPNRLELIERLENFQRENHPFWTPVQQCNSSGSVDTMQKAIEHIKKSGIKTTGVGAEPLQIERQKLSASPGNQQAVDPRRSIGRGDPSRGKIGATAAEARWRDEGALEQRRGNRRAPASSPKTPSNPDR